MNWTAIIIAALVCVTIVAVCYIAVWGEKK